MPLNDRKSIWDTLRPAGNLAGRFFSAANATVALSDLLDGSCISGGPEQFRGQSVLIDTVNQLAAALALVELDGVARRLLLLPEDVAAEQVLLGAASMPVDAILSDRALTGGRSAAAPSIMCCSKTKPGVHHRRADYATEWILLTSGTTGQPKMVAHNLSTLAGAIDHSGTGSDPIVWSTFYDIRRYGGLQIFLRAALTGGSLVLRTIGESMADFLIRAGGERVTHISGTPSHWRRALMCPSARNIAPKYVRLSGEVVDQSILDSLRSLYPEAKIVHAFASTEAGVAFDVQDGLAGFPASYLEQARDGVELKVEDGSLQIRSRRVSTGYIGTQSQETVDGFVDTGDMLERRGGRYYFVGRRDGTIKVGGWKVHPEEVEAVINRHPGVQMSLVRARKSSLTGALVVADVVPKNKQEEKPGPDVASQLEHEILGLCRGALAQHKVPIAIHFVSDLQIAATGKLVRQTCVTSS